AKARGNSSRAPQQRPSYSRPWGKPHLRIWRKKDSALLHIANGSACSADPGVRLKLNSINCVRHGRHYSLQAQGDFRGIASTGYGRRRRSVRAWRWICGVKRKPKAGNTPWHPCIVHGLDKPGVFTTVSFFETHPSLTTQPVWPILLGVDY